MKVHTDTVSRLEASRLLASELFGEVAVDLGAEVTQLHSDLLSSFFVEYDDVTGAKGEGMTQDTALEALLTEMLPLRLMWEPYEFSWYGDLIGR